MHQVAKQQFSYLDQFKPFELFAPSQTSALKRGADALIADAVRNSDESAQLLKLDKQLGRDSAVPKGGCCNERRHEVEKEREGGQ